MSLDLLRRSWAKVHDVLLLRDILSYILSCILSYILSRHVIRSHIHDGGQGGRGVKFGLLCNCGSPPRVVEIINLV